MSESEHVSQILDRSVKELALQAATAEALATVEELKAEAEGWRRRNLIMDSQLERQERAISRLEALAATWESQLSVLTDLDRLDVDLKKLITKILEGASKPRARKKTAPEPAPESQPKDRASDGITVNYS